MVEQVVVAVVDVAVVVVVVGVVGWEWLALYHPHFVDALPLVQGYSCFDWEEGEKGVMMLCQDDDVLVKRYQY